MNTLPRLSAEELLRLRNTDFSTKPGFVTASQHLADTEGMPGTSARADFDARARAWYYGDVLRRRRKELGITQKALAESVGRERVFINDVERGETDIPLSAFLRIASALGIALHLDVSLA